MALDIPLKMTGQPGIYKIPKELWFGAKEVVKPVAYTWWPPEEFKNFSVGRFDLYPEKYVSWTRDQIITFVEE